MLNTEFSPTNPATPLDSCSENQGFFYIDGIPTKGCWIDLDQVGAWEDIQLKLSQLFPSAVIDEILCADAEGFARYFLGRYDCFELDAYLEFMDDKSSTHLDDAVVMAYIENCGADGVSIADIEEAYYGEFNSDEDFAWELLESTGDLEAIPENLRCYFDVEKFASDLMFDYFESNGHYFRNL